jgi:hypothetical protein
VIAETRLYPSDQSRERREDHAVGHERDRRHRRWVEAIPPTELDAHVELDALPLAQGEKTFSDPTLAGKPRGHALVTSGPRIPRVNQSTVKAMCMPFL